jgi:hypothetical protein
MGLTEPAFPFWGRSELPVLFSKASILRHRLVFTSLQCGVLPPNAVADPAIPIAFCHFLADGEASFIPELCQIDPGLERDGGKGAVEAQACVSIQIHHDIPIVGIADK